MCDVLQCIWMLVVSPSDTILSAFKFGLNTNFCVSTEPCRGVQKANTEHSRAFFFRERENVYKRVIFIE